MSIVQNSAAAGSGTSTGPLVVGTKAASATLIATDLTFNVVEMTGGSLQTITVPTGIGIQGNVLTFRQTGTGGVTFAPGAGMTIDAAGGNRSIAAQWESVTVEWRSSTEIILEGAMAP